MTNEEIKSKIISLVPEAEFAENKQYTDAVIPQEKIHDLCKTLKESTDTAFDYLFCLSGLDINNQLMVVYHITSSVHHHSVVLKVKTTERVTPAFDTVCDIWHTAEFHEREVFDLFGITFNNHPDLRRIFMDDEFKGYPLRKDFKDEINIIER
jgi:NADH-quinone oxidoreductase subunit C